jgi:hypothetical protein
LVGINVILVASKGSSVAIKDAGKGKKGSGTANTINVEVVETPFWVEVGWTALSAVVPGSSRL